MEVGDGFWLNRDWRRTGGSAGGEHGGCRCAGTQRAHAGPTGMVAPPASDGLREAVGVFWTCY